MERRTLSRNAPLILTSAALRPEGCLARGQVFGMKLMTNYSVLGYLAPGADKLSSGPMVEDWQET